MPTPKITPHIARVIAVNEATTEAEHTRLDRELHAFRDGMRAAGGRPDLMGCDWYYLEQDIDRPMCCGVWLDWTPADVAP